MRDFEECKKAAMSGDVQAQFDQGDIYSLRAKLCQGGKRKWK